MKTSHIVAIASLAVSILCTGCVNGRLNPAVPAIVSAVDSTACKFVPGLGGEICDAIAGIVNKVLINLTVANDGRPARDVVFNGVVIAKQIPAAMADALVAKIQADPDLAARLAAAIGSR